MESQVDSRIAALLESGVVPARRRLRALLEEEALTTTLLEAIEYEGAPGARTARAALAVVEHRRRAANLEHALSPVPRAALAYLTDEDKILCVWNAHDGCWGLPGGREEPRDEGNLVTVLQREVLEECGVVVHVQSPALFMGPSTESARVHSVHVFRARLSDDAVPHQVESGAPVGWFTRDQFLGWTKFKEFYKEFFTVLDKAGG
jgi:ADP-ribose pyrophosphatase YjhB (NUDIX family)